MSIFDIPNTPWRNELLPASFRGAEFHVETGGLESGRRIVVHEFPKKELPWAEDMGRRAVTLEVRGYCIAYPFNINLSGLYQRDYRVPRNALRFELDKGTPGVLQLPTLPPITVVCPRYRLTEETKLGGYCTFDMSFVELGEAPLQYVPNAQTNLKIMSSNMKDRMKTIMDQSKQIKQRQLLEGQQNG
jgi:prophage DNA circulation protein